MFECLSIAYDPAPLPASRASYQFKNASTSAFGRSYSFSVPFTRVIVRIARWPVGCSGVAVGFGVTVGVALGVVVGVGSGVLVGDGEAVGSGVIVGIGVGSGTSALRKSVSIRVEPSCPAENVISFTFF
ncbi:hypothetical protein CA596_16265 [Paenibacillus odorifer]|nr:hypothetical protein CA596_16265 [Paenibacillus odorifer]